MFGWLLMLVGWLVAAVSVYFEKELFVVAYGLDMIGFGLALQMIAEVEGFNRWRKELKRLGNALLERQKELLLQQQQEENRLKEIREKQENKVQDDTIDGEAPFPTKGISDIKKWCSVNDTERFLLIVVGNQDSGICEIKGNVTKLQVGLSDLVKKNEIVRQFFTRAIDDYNKENSEQTTKD